MDPLSIAAIGGSLVSGIVNPIVNAKQAKKDREFSAQQSTIAHQRNLDMWNLQNEYNTPSAQMQRFKDAGLNPQLIYGQGNPGNAQQLAPYQRAEGHFPKINLDFMPMLSMFQDIRLKKAQINMMNEQRENIAARTVNEGIRSGILGMDRVLKGQLVEHQPKKFQADYNFWDSRNRLMEGAIKQRLQHTINLQTLNRINQLNASWMEKKINEYSDKGINIDKEGLRERLIMNAIEKMLNISDSPFKLKNLFN